MTEMAGGNQVINQVYFINSASICPWLSSPIIMCKYPILKVFKPIYDWGNTLSYKATKAITSQGGCRS